MGSSRGTPSRVLMVWCPDWPVAVAAADHGAPAAADHAVPAAVVSADRVVACSAAARAAGIRRGQRLRDAQRYCPGLVVYARDVGAEARAFEAVVVTLEEFCPRVEVVRPGMCAIDARGPARYFGGEEALVEKIRYAMAGRGFGCQVGIADGMFAARLAARAGQAGVVVPPGGTSRFLAPLPVWLLESPELANLLGRLGIHTVGDFAALSAGDVLARFGSAGVTAHRLARGLAPRAIVPWPPAADLSVVTEFDPPAVAAEQVMFAGKALAVRLHANLAAHGLMCVRVEVRIEFGDGQIHSRLWRHDGLLSALALAERIRLQLDGWRAATSGGSPGASPGGSFGASPGDSAGDEAACGGIAVLRLIPDQVVPDEGRQLGLWGEALVSNQAARAAVRVQAMLGHAAVTRPLLAGGRGPGDQVALVPFGDNHSAQLPADCPWPGRIPAPSPAVVYPVPLAASVTCASGEPVTVTGRAAVSAPPAQLVIEDGPPLEITAWAGPWPVCEQWWDPVRERRLARFQLVTGDGAAWLAAVADGRWIIEAGYG